MRPSTIAKGYTFYLGTSPTFTPEPIIGGHDGDASNTGSYELVTLIGTSSICSQVTSEVCQAVYITETFAVSIPVITTAMETSSVVSETGTTSSTKESSTKTETSVSSTGKETSTTGTATQTVATPTPSSKASKTEVVVVCAIAGAILMYFL
ncbi:hypothetical protein BDP55DRAFT_770320 [Colletotrichum godetiae]|uniref:Uncharacterized protein n=1 Tax=Colletotrichum godetiae TaxID=1209918 RepID=A0AAJ0ERY2_9PEZI|nr:uncharacterized protein BDP55DRAFT_770320 [Colletotrichum godetiae]KAK1673282.1 hypothetical protein BDP55DRAFT_770320 [Colletotrichum godetiae]